MGQTTQFLSQRIIEEESPQLNKGVIQAITDLTTKHAKEFNSYGEGLDRFLCYWFCRKYNVPLKSPILSSYTTEELLYEFFIYQAREEEEQNRFKNNDIIKEEQKVKEALSWADEMERLDMEAQKQEQETAKEKPEPNPYEPTEEDKEWMEQMSEEMATIEF
jgi:hypothetical protein